MTVGSLSAGQRQAVAEMRRIRDASNGALNFDDSASQPDARGWLPLKIDLDCRNTPTVSSGAQLGRRQTVTILVPPNFPFGQPIAVSHDKGLATQHHVQWGKFICLYPPNADWDASDGMMGYINRLAEWFLRAASATLDAPGEPIDPPVAYAARTAGCMVVDHELPAKCIAACAAGQSWAGAAVLCQVDDDRVDVLAWLNADDEIYRDTAALKQSLARYEARYGQEVFLAAAIVVPGPMSFEFPRTVGQLADALGDQRFSLDDFIQLAGHTAGINDARARAAAAGGPAVRTDAGSGPAVSSLYVFVGSPMRGTAGTEERLIHLAAWRLAGNEAERLSRLVQLWEARDPALVNVTRDAIVEVVVWILEAEISWAVVYERRASVVERRDNGRPAHWLHADCGKTVLVLGCGALGSPIAEYCLRGGSRKLILVDNGYVTPGILVRQPYEDADIGHLKAEALGARLRYLGFGTEIVSHVDSAVNFIEGADGAPPVDLIIDATANPTVAAMIELKRWTCASTWPPVLTVGIGHDAERGFAVLALPGATGAGVDLVRKLALVAHAESGLADVAEDFFPMEPRARAFVPEPGCSSATFRGSAPEVQALAAYLFAGALSDLADPSNLGQNVLVSARLARLASAANMGGLEDLTELIWTPDIVVGGAADDDEEPDYQIRISETALAEMRDEAYVARLSQGPLVETGGNLFGQIDDAARVVWITTATGPPLGSIQSEAEYVHGTLGVSELRAMLYRRGGGRLRFIGVWHTHPQGLASPSVRDVETMSAPVSLTGYAPPRSVLLILGAPSAQWHDWLDGNGLPGIFARLVERASVKAPRGRP
jgi:hypothetical protein